jgi:hypothetical protein
MSMDGWNSTGVNARGDGVVRHGRSSSLYRAQSTTLFNAFEERDPNAMALSELHEDDDDDEDDDGDDDIVEADERTRLRSGRPQPPRSQSGSPHALPGSARNSPRPI